MWGNPGPVPRRMRDREMGVISSTRPEEIYMDKMKDILSSLQWTDAHSQYANESSSPTDPVPIYDMAKARDSISCPNLYVGDESGHLHVLDNWFSLTRLDKVPVESIHVTESFAAVTSVRVVEGGAKVLVGTGSGYVCVLDGESLELIYQVEAHEKTVKKVDSLNGNVIVSCGKDNQISVFDLRIKPNQNPVNLMLDVHVVEQKTVNKGGRRRMTAVAGGSACNSVTDFVFLDDNRIMSAGSSDGCLKEWDLRLSYKQLNKCNPVQTIKYPSQSSVKGFSCLQVAGNKLFASSVVSDIFQWELGSMQLEAIYKSPTRFSNYSKIDVSRNGDFLACGTEEPIVHVFSTQLPQASTANNVPEIKPFKTLDHEEIVCSPVCCPLFHPWEDTMITTGGDMSIVTQWLPSIYTESSEELEKEVQKRELETDTVRSFKAEFHHVKPRDQARFLSPTKKSTPLLVFDKCLPFNNKENRTLTKLDSFPNYVVDGMHLPHVYPKLRIKLKPKTDSPFNWILSPEARTMAMKTQGKATPTLVTPPKRKDSPSTRKRRRRGDLDTNGKSPKILHYFPLASPSGIISSSISTLRINPDVVADTSQSQNEGECNNGKTILNSETEN